MINVEMQTGDLRCFSPYIYVLQIGKEPGLCMCGALSSTIIRVTTRNFEVFPKQSHDFSDDYKFPVTANETLSEQMLFLCSYY